MLVDLYGKDISMLIIVPYHSYKFLEALVCIYIFTRLFWIMRKSYHYEFKERRCSMTFFFIVIIVTLLSVGIQDYFIYLFEQYLDQLVGVYSQTERQAVACSILESAQLSYILYITDDVLRKIFCIPDILLCFSIILIKSSTDCLQGISKLDYLIKVSVFQVYKNENLRRD